MKFTELPVIFSKMEGDKEPKVKGKIYLNLDHVATFYADANGLTTVLLYSGQQYQIQLTIEKFRKYLPDGVVYKPLIKSL